MAACCFQSPGLLLPLSSSPPSVHVKPSTPASVTRTTRTHGEPSPGHMTTSPAPNRLAAGNINSSASGSYSNGAMSPPTQLDPGTSGQSPMRQGAVTSRPVSVPWKGAGSTAGSSGNGGAGTSTFRPPQSQGIPIVNSRPTRLHRRSSARTNSYGGGGGGGGFGGSTYASPFSPFSCPGGSFLQSAAVIGSRQSSLNSWSIWNPESFDSRLGRDLWGDAPSSVPRSLRSWVFVNEPNESDLSGTYSCKFVCSIRIYTLTIICSSYHSM